MDLEILGLWFRIYNYFNIPQEKFEDLFDFSIKDLTNYLSVCGLNTSGRKVELVAQTSVDFGLKMNIIASSEEEKLKLQSD